MNRKEFKKLCGQIRRSSKYLKWKTKVLHRDNLDIKTPNVHHKKSFNKILKENDIQNLDDAKKCKDLWDLNNGITIGQGEHRVVSLLERMKNNTPGFLQILREFVKKRNGN